MIGWQKNQIRKEKKKIDNAAAVIYCGINGIEVKTVPVSELSPADKFIIKESIILNDFIEENLYKKLGY